MRYETLELQGKNSSHELKLPCDCAMQLKQDEGGRKTLALMCTGPRVSFAKLGCFTYQPNLLWPRPVFKLFDLAFPKRCQSWILYVSAPQKGLTHAISAPPYVLHSVKAPLRPLPPVESDVVIRWCCCAASRSRDPGPRLPDPSTGLKT